MTRLGRSSNIIGMGVCESDAVFLWCLCRFHALLSCAQKMEIAVFSLCNKVQYFKEIAVMVEVERHYCGLLEEIYSSNTNSL